MMAETSTSDQPVFVDVGTGADFPHESMAALKEVLTSSNSHQIPNVAADATNPYVTIQQRRIRCTECDRYTAETEEKMTRHVRRVHRGENPFQCAMCDYSTYNKAVFEEHVRVHQGIKPFKCSHCPYRSASKKNTKKHELIHRPDNPNRCSICGFIAKHIRSLQNHQKQHTNSPCGDVPNKCVHCKSLFQDDLSLVQHKKICRKGNISQRNVNKSIKKKKLYEFKCSLCKWRSNNKPRILLHLIHHPNQDVDEESIDVKVLRGCGIKIGKWDTFSNKLLDTNLSPT